MDDGCANIEEIGTLLDLPAGDPRRRHLDGCPRCRALLSSYQKFMRGRADLADREAETRLGAILERELLGAATGEGPTPERETSPGAESTTGATATRSGVLADFWRLITEPRVLRPALSAAAIILVSVAIFRPWDMKPTADQVLRGEGSAGATAELVSLPPEPMPDGAILLRWRAAPEVESYEVRVLGTDLREIARYEAGRDTLLMIPVTSIAVHRERSAALLWRVVGLVGGDVVSASVPAGLPSNDP